MRALRIALVMAVAVALVMIATALTASAVTGANPTTSLSSYFVGATNVTYTFSGYRLGNNEYCTGITITFPANTDVNGAYPVSPPGSISRTGQTIRYTFTNRIQRGQPVTVSIGGITNPSAPVTQTAGPITFHLQKVNGQPLPDQSLPTGTYAISNVFLVVSLSDDDVSFDLTPGEGPQSSSVVVSVASSHPYTIARSITGDAELIGLSVTGEASGAFPASSGPRAHEDVYTAEVPWTTEGDATYTATVSYTVLQQ